MITVSSNFTDLTNFIQGGVNMNVNGITGTNETSYPYTADTQTDTGQQTTTAEEISKDSNSGLSLPISNWDKVNICRTNLFMRSDSSIMTDQ